MLKLRRTWLLLAGAMALLALVAVVAVACGGDEEEGTATATKTATGTPKATATAARTATPKPTGTVAATKTATGTPKPTGTATAGATGTPAATGTAEATATPEETEEATATPPPQVIEPDDGWTDTQIILGSHFAQSGTYGASFAPVLAGFKAYMAYVNAEKGGICGREVVMKAYDDMYEPAPAVEAIRKLVEQDKVFATVINLGTAAHSAVWEYLNEKGIPDMFVMTGAHKWGATPEEHPWTFAGLPDYFVEGTIYGKWISQNMPGAKVGVIYQNDDYGRDELAGVKNGLSAAETIVSEQPFDATAVSISSQVTNLKQSGAEAVICGCIPGHAAQLLSQAYNQGWKPQFFIGYVNSDPVMFSYASPAALEGTRTLQGNKLSTWKDDPAIAEHYEIMSKYGNMAVGNFTVEGQLVAELTEEALSRTCDNPTRQGLKEALESFDGVEKDLNIDGLGGWTFSPTDHIGVEAMRMLVAKIAPGGGGMWEYEGEVLSFR